MDLKKLDLFVLDSLVPMEKEREIVEIEGALRVLPSRRYVWKGRWDGTPVVIKYYPASSKSQRHFYWEWDKLRQLYSLNLAIPQPLFIGVDEAKGYSVVTRRIVEGVSVKTALDRDKTERTRLLEYLFQHIANQHEQGALQRDNHLDNYLWDGERVYALDAAGFQFYQRPLAVRRRIANLALLIANIGLCYETDTRNTLNCYFKNIPFKGQALQRLQNRLPKAVSCQRRRRLRRYQKKTNRSCSAFIRRESSTFTLLCDRILPASVQKLLIHEPDKLIEMSAILKNGNTCTVGMVTLKGKKYVVKRYQPKPFFYRLRHVILGSRARRSWRQMHVARLFDLPAPCPHACLEKHRSGLVSRSFLLMDHIPGIPMNQWVQQHHCDHESLQKLSQRFAALWSALGMLRARHGDMKATNLLVDKKGNIHFIDFDQVYFFLPPGVYGRLRAKDHRRFMQNWQEMPEVAALFRESVDKASPHV